MRQIIDTLAHNNSLEITQDAVESIPHQTSDRPANRLNPVNPGETTGAKKTVGDFAALNSSASDVESIPAKPGILPQAMAAMVNSTDLSELTDTLVRMLKDVAEVSTIGIRLKDGSLVHVSQTVTPVEDSDGKQVHFVTVVEDTSERQKILQELETTNNTLRVERSMLENKNIALKEIMEQIEQYKTNTNQQLQANVNRVIRPMLQILADKLPTSDQHLIGLLDSTLRDLLDPFVGKLDHLSASLTRRESEVCNMIRNGFSSKQIASVLHTSVCTVHNQRRSIRKKLEIADGVTNLESLLKSL